MVEIDELTLQWLAGLLEGEATFSAGKSYNAYKPLISIKMTDEDVVAKVAHLFETAFWLVDTKRSQQNGWKQAYETHISGDRAVHWMRTLYPLMGVRRRKQIEQAIASYKGDQRKVLPPEGVEALRQRLQNGEHVLKLAKEFGVSKSYAYLVRSGRY